MMNSNLLSVLYSSHLSIWASSNSVISHESLKSLENKKYFLKLGSLTFQGWVVNQLGFLIVWPVASRMVTSLSKPVLEALLNKCHTRRKMELQEWSSLLVYKLFGTCSSRWAFLKKSLLNLETSC